VVVVGGTCVVVVGGAVVVVGGVSVVVVGVCVVVVSSTITSTLLGSSRVTVSPSASVITNELSGAWATTTAATNKGAATAATIQEARLRMG